MGRREDAAIEHLPIATRSKLRSTQILTSMSQIVSELLQNALDAGAGHIDIGVDCEEWTCWVRDDGSGMSKSGMDILAKGLEEGRYGTSKAYAPDSLDDLSTFGFRGEALASCADICCLEISSRTARSRESWSVIVKGSKPLYNGPAVRWRRESPGTAVCIRDAFYNLPVRRLSHPTPARTLDAIRQQIQAFALVFPNVAFTLENTHSTKDEKDMVLRIPKTASMLTAFRHIYGRALVQHVDEINLSSGELRLDGFISLEGAHSKAHQFLYINRHPLALCELHHAIDTRFAASSFGKHAFDEAGETSVPRTTARRSPRKIEKRAVYVLNLTVPPAQLDNCLEPAKAAVHLRDKGGVAAFLSSAIVAFLTRHGFASAAGNDGNGGALRDGSPSPRKRRKTEYDVEDDSGYAEAEPETSWRGFVNTEPRSRGVSPVPLYTRQSGSQEGGEVLWADPHTGEIYVVDARTGNSYRQSEPPPQGDVNTSCGRPTTGRTLARKHASLDKAAMPEWIRKALEANDIYTVTESKIPYVAHLPAADPDAPPQKRYHDCRITAAERMRPDQPNTVSTAHRFTKADLRGAQVIEQVDRKFVACVVAGAVVLIDQHAADERVRVERFLKELCLGYLGAVHSDGQEGLGVRVRGLHPPVPVLLSRDEERQTRDPAVRRAFGCWGFRFKGNNKSPLMQEGVEGTSDAGNPSGYSQVFVECVPEVVANKLLLDDELRDFVKGYLAKLEDDPPSNQRAEANETTPETDEVYWLRALRWCPQQLLDLVNSKACRGAIMFNDSLSHAQCEKLVESLCETAFPFQCAHGRPSLVPLIDLGDDHGQRRRPAFQWSSFK